MLVCANHEAFMGRSAMYQCNHRPSYAIMQHTGVMQSRFQQLLLEFVIDQNVPSPIDLVSQCKQFCLLSFKFLMYFMQLYNYYCGCSMVMLHKLHLATRSTITLYPRQKPQTQLSQLYECGHACMEQLLLYPIFVIRGFRWRSWKQRIIHVGTHTSTVHHS